MTYTGGQHCSSGLRRSLAINFICSSNKIETFEKQVIDEAAHCTYAISVESEYACPLECGFGSAGAMCGGHGLCRYDTDAKKARCFCNSGHAGAGCDQSSASVVTTYGPILGLLIFVTIIMLLLAGGIGMLWRWMALRTVPNSGEAYGRLQNQFGSDGLMDNATATSTRSELSGSGF